MNLLLYRWLLLPAALAVAAVFSLPYGYYTFMRLVVVASAAATAYGVYGRKGGVTWEVVVFGLIALLFNPVFPVSLPRVLWLPIDLIVAAVFAYFAITMGWKRRL